MSQSPLALDNAEAAAVQTYRTGWRQLYRMLQAGKSLSGRERNCSFLNVGPEQPFADISAISGFDFLDDGRALAIVDWDHDGDLDVWVANRTSPRLRFLHNQNSTGHHFLQLRLTGTRCNRDAIGARVEVTLAGEPSRRFIQTVRAGEGFLSQSSRIMHFGLGKNDRVARVSIRWPGTSHPEVFSQLNVDTRYEIIQGQATPLVQNPPAQTRLRQTAPANTEVAFQATAQPASLLKRAIVCGRIPVPAFPYKLPDEVPAQWSTTERPTLISLWATWCQPCLVELAEWTRHEQDLRTSGLDILALCVDPIAQSPSDVSPTASDTSPQAFLDQMQFPYAWGYAQPETLDRLERVYQTLFDDARPFPVPTSFLLDDQGCVVAIYRGAVDIAQLRSDLALLDAGPEEVRTACTPFPGKWLGAPPRPQPLALAKSLQQVDSTAAEAYLHRMLQLQTSKKRLDYWEHASDLAATYLALATLQLERGDARRALDNFQQSLQHDPDNAAAHANLGSTYFRLRQWQAAEASFAAAARLQPQNADVHVNRGLTLLQLRNVNAARSALETALKITPDHFRARYNLARLEGLLGRDLAAVQHLEYLASHAAPQVAVLHDLAWLLATSSEATVRDGATALRLAIQVCRSVPSPDATMLRTLAAAQAANGNFDDAVATIERAIKQVESPDTSGRTSGPQTQTSEAQTLRELLSTLRAGQPIRRGRTP